MDFSWPGANHFVHTLFEHAREQERFMLLDDGFPAVSGRPPSQALPARATSPDPNSAEARRRFEALFTWMVEVSKISGRRKSGELDPPGRNPDPPATTEPQEVGQEPGTKVPIFQGTN